MSPYLPLLCGAAALCLPLSAQTLQLSKASGGGERHPVLSLDGQRISWLAMVQGRRELFQVGIDGGAPSQLSSAAAAEVAQGVFAHWPSLSSSDDGRFLAYWNLGGVRVLDTRAGTDTRVGPVFGRAFPSLVRSRKTLVWQASVQGSFEVFVALRSGTGSPLQLTSKSGPGDRLPQGHGDLLLYQKHDQGQQELFLFDGKTGQTRQLTKGSGPGHRYGRFSPDGQEVIYEAQQSGQLEVMLQPLSGGSPRVLSKVATCGSRTAVLSGDDQAFFQASARDAELYLVDDDGKNQTLLLRQPGGGLRRLSCDAGGRVLVYQAPVGDSLEVFRHRLCPKTDFSVYGQHGRPSTGSLQHYQSWYRCDLSLGLRTSLPAGRPVLFCFSATQFNPGIPLAGAPGNFIYQGAEIILPLMLQAQGQAEFRFRATPGLRGTAYYQWAVADPAANTLGVVTSKGVKTSM